MVGYCFFGVLCMIVLPFLYSPAKWYYILIMLIVAPVMSVTNSYGAGLTDWWGTYFSCLGSAVLQRVLESKLGILCRNLASTYGKLAIVVFAAWAGSSNQAQIFFLYRCCSNPSDKTNRRRDLQGVIAGCVCCGVLLGTTNAACSIMGDFKTGYFTQVHMSYRLES